MFKPLSLFLFLSIFSQSAFAQAQRLIHSGFEPGVTITSDLDDITGVDQSTGYDWSSNPSWIKSSRFVYLLSRTLDTSQYQNSSIITATGPQGNSTKVLKLDNIKDDPDNQYVSRNEFSLFGHEDGDIGPRYTEGYSRYWMKIPDIRSRIPLADKAPWFLIMEWKEGNTGVSLNTQECADCCGQNAGSTNNYRIGIYIDKARRESEYRWRIQGQQMQPCWNTEWRYTNTTAEVPLGEWILVEAYMKKHPTDGRVAFAVNGEIILDTDLTAPEGFTGRTEHKDNPIPLKFWSPMKNYIDTLWYEQGGPISLLYDDLEIWSSVPKDASFEPSVPSTPPNAPTGIWIEAESGTVGDNWEVAPDEEAANGSFVRSVAEEKSMDEAPPGAADRISYRFNVTQADSYLLWGRVLTPSNGKDSFWARVNGGKWELWSPGVFTEWSWVGKSRYNLSAGSNTIDIAYREIGAQLDKLYLTAGSDFPTGLGGGETDCASINWDNTSFVQPSGMLVAEWEAVPGANDMNGVVGLSDGEASAYDDLACIVRFNKEGNIDARNGSTYSANQTIAYEKDKAYRVRIEADLVDHTYDAYVTPEGGSEQTIGTDFAFRTEQSTTSQLNNYAINTESGCLQVDKFTATSPGSGNVTVRARGVVGSEQIEIRYQNQRVGERITLSTSFQEYKVQVNNANGNFKVAFINDNGSRDAEIDWLQVGTTKRQAETRSTNTAVWQNGSCGGSNSQRMNCNGYIDFGTMSGVTSGKIVIRAKGQQGNERMRLEVNGELVKTWNGVATAPANYSYDGYSGGSIKVLFDNDGGAGSTDRNLAINYLDVCGVRQEAEAATTGDGYCGVSDGSFVWLWCNGSLSFGNVGCNSSARTISNSKAIASPSAEGWNQQSLRTYPNPATDQLTVAGGDDYQVTLYDLSGRKVMQHNHLKGIRQLDVNHVLPGVYILKMNDSEHELRQRVIIK